MKVSPFSVRGLDRRICSDYIDAVRRPPRCLARFVSGRQRECIAFAVGHLEDESAILGFTAPQQARNAFQSAVVLLVCDQAVRFFMRGARGVNMVVAHEIVSDQAVLWEGAVVCWNSFRPAFLTSVSENLEFAQAATGRMRSISAPFSASTTDRACASCRFSQNSGVVLK